MTDSLNDVGDTDTILIKKLETYSAATIHEAQGRIGALNSAIKPVAVEMSCCGPAFTVQCAPRDNLMLQVAISSAARGDIVVVSAGEIAEAGSFGEVLANACLAKGLSGLVTDTGVRDSRELTGLGFPVFSSGICIKGTVKETIGPMNMPIVVGGELIEPGDIVRGDADGVVVVKRERLEEVIEKCEARIIAEAEYIAAYWAGKSVLDVSNLRGVLASKNFPTK